MSRFHIRATVTVSLILAACGQTPAPVELKGKNVYGRDGVGSVYASSYSSPPAAFAAPKSYVTGASSSVPHTTQSSAAVQSIGVSDLAPPPKSSAVAPSREQAAPVNKWTEKPRETAAAGTHQPVKLIGARDEKSVGFMWPVNGKKIVSNFGPKGAGKANDGINIASADGEPVWAAADGEVVHVGDELKGYGNMVMIQHSGGKTTTYAHLARAAVDKYDRVKQGDIIGYVGSTGNVKSPQLHFALHDGKSPVDPQKYLSRSLAGL